MMKPNDQQRALSALFCCMTLSENLWENSCQRCPLHPCDPDERLACFRDLLRSVAPDYPQASSYADLLDGCLENDEGVCVSCPYYDRCQNLDPSFLLEDIFSFLKESGYYEKEST